MNSCIRGNYFSWLKISFYYFIFLLFPLYVIDFQDKKDWKKNQHKLHQVNSELIENMKELTERFILIAQFIIHTTI